MGPKKQVGITAVWYKFLSGILWSEPNKTLVVEEYVSGKRLKLSHGN